MGSTQPVLVGSFDHSHCTGPASLAVLHAELHKVVNWYQLGLELLVEDHRLLIIRQDNPNNTVMCRNATLTWWWNNADDRTWHTLVKALSKSGQHNLATEIAGRYGKMPCSE